MKTEKISKETTEIGLELSLRGPRPLKVCFVRPRCGPLSGLVVVYGHLQAAEFMVHTEPKGSYAGLQMSRQVHCAVGWSMLV